MKVDWNPLEAATGEELFPVYEELLTRTAAIEQAGEPTITGWPEWGTLSAPVRLVA